MVNGGGCYWGYYIETIVYTYTLYYWSTLTRDRANTLSYIYTYLNSEKFPKFFTFFVFCWICVLFMSHCCDRQAFGPCGVGCGVGVAFISH